MTEYSIESLIKSKVNDELFSDVLFLIGENETKMYANKTILRLGSPVFDRMFFGEMPMDCSRPITIPDMSPAGFLNMIKYIYGHGFEMDLTELYSTWQAGDKYLVHNFENTLCNYIKKSITKSNICLVYDQLIKIQRANGLLDQVKETLKLCGKIAFEAEHFVQLSEEALVDMLTIEWLNIAEIDILKACLKWIERQIVKLDLQPTRENKIQLFQPLKPFIRFSDLQTCEIGIFEEIRNLLTDNEILSLFFHLADRSKPIPIEYQGHRILNVNGNLNLIQSVSISKDLSNANCSLDAIETSLKSDQVAYITSIVTLSALRHINGLELYMFRNGSQFGLTYERTRINNEWHFKFSECFKLNPGDVYQLSFRFIKTYIFCSEYKLSDQWQLEFNDNKHFLDFTLTLTPVASNKPYHCVKQIEFTFFPDIYNVKCVDGLH